MAILEKVSTTQLIIDYILDKIRDGDWKSGDQLPNERDFAAELGVSRMPVREAFASLSALGIIEAKQGSGTYIREYDSNMVAQIMSVYSVLGKTSARDVFETRAVLESFAVRLMIERATDEEIEEFGKQLERARDFIVVLEHAKDPESERKKFQKLNNFHRSIALGTKNQFLVQFSDSIRVMTRQFFDQSNVDHVETFKQGYIGHEQIYQAIKDRNKDLAQKLIYQHLMDELDFFEKNRKQDE